MKELKFKEDDRILVLAPHPDDEVIGCAGVIQRALSMKLPIHITFLTYGDSNQLSFLLYRKYPVLMPRAVTRMGLVRYDEAVAATRILGLSQGQLTFLGYPDFRTLNIWCSRWAQQSPLKGILTRSRAVPYKSALRPGALHKGEEILKDLKAIISRVKPTKIFVSHPADYHGDHLAYYLYTRVALWDLRMGEVELYPYLIHFLRWPKPKGFRLGKPLEPPHLLSEQISWWRYQLTPEQFILKRRALEAHRSQYRSAARYLLSFIRGNELFGDLPVIKLHPDSHGASLRPEQEKNNKDTPFAELTAKEQRAFVGVKWKSIRLHADELIISIDLSRPLAKNVGASIYVFGYRVDKGFGQMPKIHVRLGVMKYSVYDKSTRLQQGVIKVTRDANQVLIRVPLNLLNDPKYILTNARTYLGEVPLDSVSWRILQLPLGPSL